MKSYLLKYTLLSIQLFSINIFAFAQIKSTVKTNYHDFDFWIGSWDVYKYGTDTIIGSSNIYPILNHKTIEENYQSTIGPYKGTSHNIFNVTKNRWEQYWVDNGGLALHITGGLEAGNMVLSNCNNDNCNKIIWTPMADYTVRQEWFQSSDSGSNWNKVFDGHYKSRNNIGGVKPALPLLQNYPNIRDFTISSDGTEAYITVQNPTEETRIICRLSKSNGVWSQPIPASFSGKYKDLEPYFSPDNKRLYFTSNRPNAFEKENYDIYFVERQHPDSIWSKPQNIGLPINTEVDEYYPSISKSGNLYFTCVKTQNKGKDDIYYSQFENGKYKEPIALDSTINTLGYEFNSFISPDETYIIFSGYNRLDGVGSGDLYISYKNEDGSWSKSLNLSADVNSRYIDYCPFVDVKKGVLYFTSRRNVNSGKTILNNNQLNSEILKYQNGTSRIYKVEFDGMIYRK